MTYLPKYGALPWVMWLSRPLPGFRFRGGCRRGKGEGGGMDAKGGRGRKRGKGRDGMRVRGKEARVE